MNGDPLAGLKDIHLPPDIGWWPPAVGWWLVLLFSTALIYYVSGKIFLFLKNRRYRKEALAEYRKLIAEYEENGNGGNILQEVSVLLRRVAVHAYGRYEVSELSGDQWLEFLDRTSGTDDFTSGAGSVLGCDIYRSMVNTDFERVFAMVEKWIRVHK